MSPLLFVIATLAASGLPGLLLHRRSRIGQWLATGLNVAGGLAGLSIVLICLISGKVLHPIQFAWALPVGHFSIAADHLSCLFLIPVFFISALGSIYGLGYWDQSRHPGNGRRLRFCWGLLSAGMAMVVISRDAVLLLMAWELMALSAYFLITTEENQPEVRTAGWVYLIATHTGTLCLIGFFCLLQRATGSFDLWPTLPAKINPTTFAWLFALGTTGFGLKAGLFPLHVWLPGAHANAPSHVSAILSGVMLKMGIYGLVRIASLSPHPPTYTGAILLAAGTATAILGIAYAIAQNDLKRLLAYSSIENIGIIVMGIGLATLGRTLHRADFILLGLGSALLHMLNHSCFKPLLFMGSGGILHTLHTRNMDTLGGLGKRMPRLFILFVIGSIAIAGLPPLNGFISELMLYIGLFKAASAPGKWGWIALAAPALAGVGAMAVAAFVKLIGTVFGGEPRSNLAASASEEGRQTLQGDTGLRPVLTAPADQSLSNPEPTGTGRRPVSQGRTSNHHAITPSMFIPMWILAACCVAIGLFPALMIGILNRAIADWSPQTLPSLATLLPLAWLSILAIAMLLMIVGSTLLFYRSSANRSARSAGTWDCGYIRPTRRMQYTGSSFSQMLVELLAWVLLPIRKVPVIKDIFAGATKLENNVPDVALHRGLRPAFTGIESVMSYARIIQSGPIQIYLLYILAILIALMVFG